MITPAPDENRTLRLLLIRGVIAIAWAAVFATVAASLTTNVTVVAGVLLVLCPLTDGLFARRRRLWARAAHVPERRLTYKSVRGRSTDRMPHAQGSAPMLALAPKPADLSPRLRSASGWPLVATPLGTEIGLDTGTPMGNAVAQMAVVFAEFERDFIRMRTYPRGAAGQGGERRHAQQVKIDARQADRCSPSLERPRVEGRRGKGEPR